MQSETKTEASESEIKAKKAAIAAKKRKQAMDQMNRLQKQFVTQNQDLLGKEFLEGKGPHRQDDDEEPLGILPQDSGFPVCLGIDRSTAKCDCCRRITCILCQEDEDVTASGQALVCAAFMQKYVYRILQFFFFDSCLLSKKRKKLDSNCS
ncbi:unnamed protein product [Onchocerca flexuosa]|uniref:E3 ubiquitin-protein ligase n=1 Tax=Onchocerca flexuosa TaxID=387005 RepID=A0A183HVG7_9BILA|nr:unnamed protein product [Onchocerca flexuosa]